MIDIRLTDNGETVDLAFAERFAFRCDKRWFTTWIQVAAEWIARAERPWGNSTDFSLNAEEIDPPSLTSFDPIEDDGEEDNAHCDDLISRALREAGEI